MAVDDWRRLVGRGGRCLVTKEGCQVDEPIAVKLRLAIVDEPPPVGPARPVTPVARQVDDVFYGPGLCASPPPPDLWTC